MTDRIEELGRAKEGVLVTYRVAFDDGTTSIIQPSKHAIAFEWQTSTYLGQISDQGVFGKAAKAAKAAAKAATTAAKAAATNAISADVLASRCPVLRAALHRPARGLLCRRARRLRLGKATAALGDCGP
mgnify:CR=1 FL=1